MSFSRLVFNSYIIWRVCFCGGLVLLSCLQNQKKLMSPSMIKRFSSAILLISLTESPELKENNSCLPKALRSADEGTGVTTPVLRMGRRSDTYSKESMTKPRSRFFSSRFSALAIGRRFHVNVPFRNQEKTCSLFQFLSVNYFTTKHTAKNDSSSHWD